MVDDATLEYLAAYRFGGDVWGYPEGEVYFPYSPLMVVEATFAEAVLLETVLLSILNHDSAIASAASRMTWVSCERPCIEMGTRRTHEDAAVAAARAAYVAGFDATSNLAAGRRYGIPTTGTSAHAFTLLHDTERDAFTAQVRSLGSGTTLLVDTFDIAEAVRLAVEIAGPELGAVRIDCGDLGMLAQHVRDQLDALGAKDTRIVVTSDLDEHSIAALAAAPVDGYGVGTSLVTGSGHPTCGVRLQARLAVHAEGADGRRREEEQGQGLHGRPEVRAAPPRTRRASPRPRWSGRARPPRATTTDRTAAGPARAGRRGRRPRAAQGRPGTAPRLAARSCPCRPARCPAVSRSSRRCTCDVRPTGRRRQRD